MNLSLSILARQMEKYNPQLHIQNDVRNIQYVQLGEFTGKTYDSVVCVSLKDKPKVAESCNENDPVVICANGNGYLLFYGYPLHVISNEILKISYFYNHWESKLKEAFNQNIPWQKIVDLFEEIFNQPMLLINLRGELVGITKQYENLRITPGWRTIANKKCVTLEHCEFVARNELQHTPTIIEPVSPFVKYLQFGIFKKTLFTYTLYINEWNRALDAADIHLAEAVQEIASSTHYNSNLNQSLIDQIFVDILEGRYPEKESMYGIFKQMKWKQDDSFQIAVVKGASQNPRKDVWAVDVLKQTLPEMVCFHWNGFIALLFPSRQWRDIQGQMRIRLQSFYYYSGVSMPFRQWEKLPAHFKQAQACLLLHDFLSTPMVLAWEHATNIALLTCNQCCTSMEMLSPAYLALKKHDKKHGTELLKTLSVFLQQGRNAVKTAQVLHVHRNTLLNRLTRIEDICPVNLDDCGEQIFFLISCGYVTDNQKDITE